MNDSFGSAMTASLVAFRSDRVVKTSDRDTDTYTVKGGNWCLRLFVNPKAWLGMRFELFDENGLTILQHKIDTDLYRPVDELDRMFYGNIEQEIVAFVKALANSEILIGTVKGKPAMIVPDAYLIRKGRFFSGGMSYKSLEKAKTKGVFRPLLLQTP